MKEKWFLHSRITDVTVWRRLSIVVAFVLLSAGLGRQITWLRKAMPVA